MVSYINKHGGMSSGSLCALLWRLLSWCHPRGIILRARHIPGNLNVIADKLFRHNQVIQTEWSLSQQVLTLLCSRWTQPRVDLFATRFNHKLPRFVSLVPDSEAWAVDALSLQWDHLEAYAFPPHVPAPPGNLEVEGSGLSQDDPHRSRVAKHALVLGLSEPVHSDSLQASPGTRSSDSTLQRDDSQESRKPQSSCLAPRSLTIPERGFSD